jgi:cytochrome-b5 reductase
MACFAGLLKVGPRASPDKPGASAASRFDIGEPRAIIVPPGGCQLGDAWTACTLVCRDDISSDVACFTFALPDASKSLGLPTCACILVRTVLADGEVVVRPYTPVSTNCEVGMFVLMVKRYPNGKMSGYMHALQLGSRMAFQHLTVNVKIQYPFGRRRRIGMIAGGTGITPCLQALHALLALPGDDAEISLLYGSRTASDLLAYETLQRWAASYTKRLAVRCILSAEPETSLWKGARGRIGSPLIEEFLPPPSSDCLILVCGPPPLYAALCGPRGEPSLSGVLASLGYRAGQVYKF